RKRLIVVGTRSGHAFRFPEKTHSPSRQGLLFRTEPWVTAGTAFRNLPPPSSSAPGNPQGHVHIQHTKRVRERFSTIPPGGYDYVRKRSRLAADQPSRSL